MKFKPTVYLLLLSLFFITEVNAQFAGYYNLQDGGVDMPSSSLCVMPNNEFLLFYYGGYKTGTWKEVDKDNITFTEIKTTTVPIGIYGKLNKNLTGINIDVYGLAKANAFINFSKDTLSKKQFQPIFNDWANCLSGEYQIKKKPDEYNWVTISYPANITHSIRYPYKALTYTFPLDKKYNDYVVVQNEDALEEKMELTLTKKGETYSFSINDDKKLEREELTPELLKKIDNAKKAIYRESFSIIQKLGTNITAAATGRTDIYKPVLKPIFIAKCKTNNDYQSDDTEDNFKLLPMADRPNGFYAVLNFKENEYDEKKYELAKEPSIKEEDMLSVNKIISDRGGYEIQIIFTEKGSLKFAELSRNNIRKPVAIVVNKLIISSPVFDSEITAGKANIGGGLSETEVDGIIANLKK